MSDVTPDYPTLGTVCHRGHAMQATCDYYVTATPDGDTESEEDARPAFVDSARVYCAEDCADIPDVILAAAIELFARAYPV